MHERPIGAVGVSIFLIEIKVFLEKMFKIAILENFLIL